MFDELFGRISAEIKGAESQSEKLLDLLNHILEKLSNDEIALNQFAETAEFIHYNAPIIDVLSQLKDHLSEISEICAQTHNRLIRTNIFNSDEWTSRSGRAFYVTVDPLHEASNFFGSAASALQDSRSKISDLASHPEILRKNIFLSDAHLMDQLSREIHLYFDNIQSMQALYERASEEMRNRARLYERASEEMRNRARLFCDCEEAPLYSGGTSSSSKNPSSTSSGTWSTSKNPSSYSNGISSTSSGTSSAYSNGSASSSKKTDIEVSKVHFSAVAPKVFTKGEYSMVEILMYEDAFRHMIDEIIDEADDPVKEIKGSTLSIGKSARIRVTLRSPDLEIEDNEQELDWEGEFARFSFAVDLPREYRKSQILFTAAIYINNVIATRLKFIAKCQAQEIQRMEIIRKDVLSAFISYASQDRSQVAMIVHGMKKARPDMDIFFDVNSLRSGDHWENRLWAEIDKRDILYLCWSRSAKNSKWVEAEWRYALKNKGEDGIEPVPIESPEVCPPPVELAQMHFNDMLLYIANMNPYA